MGGLNQGVWQHTYVQNAACNHFRSGQAGGVLVTGARRSDTGFLATLLQGLGILAFAFDQILVNLLAETWKVYTPSSSFRPTSDQHLLSVAVGPRIGCEWCSAEGTWQGRCCELGACLSWRLWEGRLERPWGETLQQGLLADTTSTGSDTWFNEKFRAHTLSKKRKTVQLFHMYLGWMVIHDSLFDRNTGKRSQNCKDEAIPCYQWCDINMRVEERVHSRRKGFTFRRPLAEMTDVVFFFDLEYWITPVLAILLVVSCSAFL